MAKAKRTSTSKEHKLPAPPAYSLGSPVDSLDFGQPSLTSTHFPELLALANQAAHHYGTDKNGNVRQKLWVLKEYFKKERLSNGSLVSPRLATMLATIVRGVEARKGGRPRKSNKTGETVKP